MKSWLDKFAEKGLGYGPSFSGLSALRAYPGENLATANVNLKPKSTWTKIDESIYPLHPATLDNCFQLALIACHAGQVDRFEKAFVPIDIDEMFIWVSEQRGDDMTLGYGIATGELRGLRAAYARTQLFTASGVSMLDVKEIRCVAYDGSGSVASRIPCLPREPYMRLIWKPDVSCLSNYQARTMFAPVKSIAKMAPLFDNFDRLAVYILVQISTVQQPVVHRDQPKHIQKFLAWIQRCFESAKAGDLPFSSEALSASGQRRSEVIDCLSSQMNDIVEIKLAKRIYDNLPDILSNQTSGLQVAIQDNLLAELYASSLGITAAYPQLLCLLDLIAHKNPRMKILEIGGGTGGTTRLVAKALKGNTSHKHYQDYTFTDIGTSFLSSAEVNFSNYKGMIYKTLDIEKDPNGQGYEPVYDLVIASDVLHTTRQIADAVRNARKLLKAGGKMLLIELTRELLGTGIVLGTLPDYWNGEEDWRRDSPLLNNAKWNEVLSNNGFSGIDIILDDYPDPFSMSSVILTTAVESDVSPLLKSIQRKCVYIVHWADPSSFASTLANQLQENFDPVLVPLTDPYIPGRSRIICLNDINGYTLSHPGYNVVDTMQRLVCQASSLIWVSAGGLIQASDPQAAITIGLLRVITTEMPTSRFISMDFEAGFDQSSVELARAVVEKELLIEEPNQGFLKESEYGFSNGLLHVSRLVPDRYLNQRFKLQDDSREATDLLPLRSQGPVGAAFQHPGLLNSLYFKSDFKFSEPLKDDWVEIKTSAIGLNMKVKLALLPNRSCTNSSIIGLSGCYGSI